MARKSVAALVRGETEFLAKSGVALYRTRDGRILLLDVVTGGPPHPSRMFRFLEGDPSVYLPDGGVSKTGDPYVLSAAAVWTPDGRGMFYSAPWPSRAFAFAVNEVNWAVARVIRGERRAAVPPVVFLSATEYGRRFTEGGWPGVRATLGMLSAIAPRDLLPPRVRGSDVAAFIRDGKMTLELARPPKDFLKWRIARSWLYVSLVGGNKIFAEITGAAGLAINAILDVGAQIPAKMLKRIESLDVDVVRPHSPPSGEIARAQRDEMFGEKITRSKSTPITSRSLPLVVSEGEVAIDAVAGRLVLRPRSELDVEIVNTLALSRARAEGTGLHPALSEIDGEVEVRSLETEDGGVDVVASVREIGNGVYLMGARISPWGRAGDVVAKALQKKFGSAGVVREVAGGALFYGSLPPWFDAGREILGRSAIMLSPLIMTEEGAAVVDTKELSKAVRKSLGNVGKECPKYRGAFPEEWLRGVEIPRLESATAWTDVAVLLTDWMGCFDVFVAGAKYSAVGLAGSGDGWAMVGAFVTPRGKEYSASVAVVADSYSAAMDAAVDKVYRRASEWVPKFKGQKNPKYFSAILTALGRVAEMVGVSPEGPLAAAGELIGEA